MKKENINKKSQINNCYENCKIICRQDVICHFKFKDGFEYAIDSNGIIWIKSNKDLYFDRPCMKYCFDAIRIRNESIAKFVLNKSCEIQDSRLITKRAQSYL